MPTTEQIFYEAKQRTIPPYKPRRPSTIVDEHGCVISHGFIIPTRSSSKASLESMAGSSSGSSINPSEIPGTPASPISVAPPGYSQPTGSLYNAPEMEILKRTYTNSMVAPTTTLSHLPVPPRRQTEPPPHQTSRWDSTDQEGTTCNLISGIAQLLRQTPAHPLPRPPPLQANNNPSVTIVAACEAENAIESDSESEDGENQAHPAERCGIAAMRAKPTYLQRRALQAQAALARSRRSSSGSTALLAAIATKAAPARENAPPSFFLLPSSEVCETPREVRAFSREERVSQREMPASASRPSPGKGPFKRHDSMRSSGASGRCGEGGGVKRVSTEVRRESGVVVRVGA